MVWDRTPWRVYLACMFEEAVIKPSHTTNKSRHKNNCVRATYRIWCLRCSATGKNIETVASLKYQTVRWNHKTNQSLLGSEGMKSLTFDINTCASNGRDIDMATIKIVISVDLLTVVYMPSSIFSWLPFYRLTSCWIVLLQSVQLTVVWWMGMPSLMIGGVMCRLEQGMPWCQLQRLGILLPSRNMTSNGTVT